MAVDAGGVVDRDCRRPRRHQSPNPDSGRHPQPLSSDPDNGRDVESLPVASSHCEPNRRQLVLYRSPSVQYSRSARIIQ